MPLWAGCPGSLALGDPGDHEPQPDHSQTSDVPVVFPPNRKSSFGRSGAAEEAGGFNPLKIRPKSGAFRPPIECFRSSYNPSTSPDAGCLRKRESLHTITLPRRTIVRELRSARPSPGTEKWLDPHPPYPKTPLFSGCTWAGRMNKLLNMNNLHDATEGRPITLVVNTNP